MIYNDKIVESINKLIIYLKSRQDCQNVSINFQISNDQFHKNIPKNVLEKYDKVDFVSKETLKPYVLDKRRIQNDGNAKDNNLNGTFDKSVVPAVNYISKFQDIIQIKNCIVISANGNICSERHGCSTYKEEDQLAYGNILSKSFLDIISKLPNI